MCFACVTAPAVGYVWFRSFPPPFSLSPGGGEKGGKGTSRMLRRVFGVLFFAALFLFGRGLGGVFGLEGR